MVKTIGLIGLGNAGRPIGERLLGKGYSLKVFDLRAEAARELIHRGAVRAASPVEATSEVTITVLPSSDEARAAVMGDRGILAGMKPGFILLDLSGTDPVCAREIDQEIRKRDGCFLGGTLHADGAPAVTIPRGLLSIVVGGEKKAFEACQNILSDLAQKVVLLPHPWTPKALKISVIMLSTASTIMIAEICAWLAAQGIDPRLFLKVAQETGSSATASRVEQFFRRTQNYGGALSNSHKDLRQALKLAADLNLPLPFSSLANQIQEMARANGFTRLPSPAAIGRLYELLTGLDLGKAVLEDERPVAKPGQPQIIELGDF